MFLNAAPQSTGVIFWAPEIWKVEQEWAAEHIRIAAQEKRKGTPPSEINEILTSRIAVAYVRGVQRASRSFTRYCSFGTHGQCGRDAGVRDFYSCDHFSGDGAL